MVIDMLWFFWKVEIFFRKTRDEAAEILKRFTKDTGVPQTLVSDGAGEYIHQEFRRNCRKQKKKLETWDPYTAQENG